VPRHSGRFSIRPTSRAAGTSAAGGAEAFVEGRGRQDAAAPLARAEPRLPVPLPEPKPQADAPPATSGGGYGYLTCSIAMYCLDHGGKWTPDPAAAEPMPEPKPPGPRG